MERGREALGKLLVGALLTLGLDDSKLENLFRQEWGAAFKGTEA